MALICSFCLDEGEGNEDTLRSKCYKHCQESEDGKHEPDASSFHLERDGVHVYLDVNCLHCGQSGCIGRFNADEVSWE